MIRDRRGGWPPRGEAAPGSGGERARVYPGQFIPRASITEAMARAASLTTGLLIFILLAVSGLSGYVIGRSGSSWPALIMAGATLAMVCAVFLQEQEFTALPGISMIVACLMVNQIAYVLAKRRPG